MVSPEFIAELRPLLSKPKLGAATITMRNRFSNGHHRDSRLLRLFRRDPSISYLHRIHEDASTSIGSMLRARRLEMTHLISPIDHLGYQKDRAQEKSKKERDRTILKTMVDQDPSDVYSRFKLLELARFWADTSLGEEAAAQALGALRRRDCVLAGSHVGGELMVTLTRFLFPKDPSSALQLLAEFDEEVVASPAYLFGRGQLYEEVGDLEAAGADFEACLGLDDPTLQMVTTRPLMGLARLALAAGDLPGAIQRVDEALRHSPKDAEALLAALSFRLNSPGQVEAFLKTHEWTPVLASALESSVELSAISYLRGARVEEAYGRLREFVSWCPSLGIGMLVCDLILSRNSNLDLEIELEDADRALRRWLVHLMGLGQPQLVAAFAANAPSLLGTFPWLRESLGLKAQ
jgi:tetratricopeptide (TPR) repeat protein